MSANTVSRRLLVGLLARWTPRARALSLSQSVIGTLLVFGFFAVVLFAAGYKDYPDLHTILDTGMFLLTRLLALLLCDMADASTIRCPNTSPSASQSPPC